VVPKRRSSRPGMAVACRRREPIAPAEMEDDDTAVVDAVFDEHGHLSGLYLSTLTHRPGSPWHQTWNAWWLPSKSVSALPKGASTLIVRRTLQRRPPFTAYFDRTGPAGDGS
jgi:hypothetical protein